MKIQVTNNCPLPLGASSSETPQSKLKFLTRGYGSGVLLTERVARGGREILCRRAISPVGYVNLKPTIGATTTVDFGISVFPLF